MDEFTLDSQSLNYGESGIPYSPSLPTSDLSSLVSISNYKGLSSSLITTQLLPYLRPEISCQIVNDSVSYNSTLYTSATTMIAVTKTAPDNVICKVGRDSSNNLAFWKIIDGTNPASWSALPDVILRTSAQWNASFTPALGISKKYLNGHYVIDIFYIDDVQLVRHYQSLDSGATFTLDTQTFLPWTDYIAVASYTFGLTTVEPLINADGTVFSVFFVAATDQFAYSIDYTTNTFTNQIKYAYYDGNKWSSLISWGSKMNNQYWRFISNNNIDAFRDDDTCYIAFSGYKFLNDNINYVGTAGLGIYMTRLLDPVRNLWSEETAIIESSTNSSISTGYYRHPRLDFDGTYLWLTYNANIITSIDNNATPNTLDCVFSSRSKDFINFSYPTLLMNDAGLNIASLYSLSFTSQNNYYYLNIDDQVWQYIKNQYVADVTNDVINYQVNESVGSTSSIVLVIGNANGKWFGPSPTESGYQAIAKDSKLYLKQGYYIAPAEFELFPRNVYYIDDISQEISSNRNDLTITARDWSKKLKVIKSKYSYNLSYDSPYFCIFSEQNAQDWTAINGTPSFANNIFSGDGCLLALSSKSLNDIEGYVFYVDVRLPTVLGKYVNIYPLWRSQTDYLKIKIEYYLNGSDYGYLFTIVSQSSILGGPNTITTAFTSSSDIGQDGSHCWARVLCQISNFGDCVFKHSLAFGVTPVSYPALQFSDFFHIASVNIDGPMQWATSTHYNAKYGVYNLGTYYECWDAHTSSAATEPGVGASWTSYWQISKVNVYSGCGLIKANYNKTIAIEIQDSTGWSVFSNANLCPVGKSNTSKEVIKYFGSLGSIFDYDINKFVGETYIKSSDYYMQDADADSSMIFIKEGGSALRKTPLLTDGHFECDAINDSSSSSRSILFSFRSDPPNLTSMYSYFFIVTDDGAFTNVTLCASSVLVGTTTTYTLFSTGDSSIGANNLNLRLNEWHKYRISFVNNTIDMFVDDVHVFSYIDYNSTIDPNSGLFGFSSSVGYGNVKIKNVSSDQSYYQLESVSVNPGDELENSIMSALTSSRMFSYSDMYGRFKMTNFPLTLITEPVTYSYENSVISTSTDRSDKEYSNRVTVFGSGVMAIASDSDTISSTTTIRDEIIVDYKLSTYQDVLNRANYELNSNFRYTVQSDPFVIMNVGSELFDVIAVTNTDSDVTENVRVYNQTFTVDWNSRRYQLKIGTGLTGSM